MKRKVVSLWEDDAWEFLVAFLGATGGVTLLIKPTVPNSISNTLPDWIVTAWAVQLIVGCTLVAIGLVSRKFRIEVPGLAMLAPASLVYMVVVVYVAGIKGFLAAMPYLLFSLACVGRIRKLFKLGKIVRAGQ